MLKKLIIFVVFLGALTWYWQSLNSPLNAAGTERIFTISQGENAEQIANNLRQAELIKSVFYFKYYVKRNKLKLQAGEYLISPKLSAREIAGLLAAGQALSRERAIKITEGWNLKDIGAYLQNQVVSSADFLGRAERPIKNWQFDFLKPNFLDDAPDQVDLEGYLFPDTYKIFKDAIAEEIIQKMLSNFDKKVTPGMREEIKRQKKTIFEIVILASIIEKEVRSEADMKIVAGLFRNRLEVGIPLQADATLSYILDDKIGGHTIEETKIDSPYNTYKYRGLPPGPIANPGLNAIRAAIYPESTPFMYFLSDPATGKTIFSRTLDEHNFNKSKYLK
jgi:UPF0755 protein